MPVWQWPEDPAGKKGAGTMTDEKRAEIREAILLVYEAEKEKGYSAIDQFVGYLCTGEPSYLTNHRDARRIACRYDRDELLEELLTAYVG